MLRLLVPIDGSKVSNRAVDRVVQMLGWYRENPEIHLLNVQPPVPEGAMRLIAQKQIESYHREEGEKELATARRRLAKAGIAYTHHIGIGEPGPMIASYARARKIDLIVMGTRGHGSLAGILLGSVATKVIHLATVPVLLVK